MTAAEFLDACASASWRLTPELAAMLDDDDVRETLYRELPANPQPEQRGLLRALMRCEIRYRDRLWNGIVNDVNDRYENIYRCAFLLYRIGRPDDVDLLWQAKWLNMDVGSSLGVEYFVGAGVAPTLEYLDASDLREATEIAGYIRHAFVDGAWAQWQADWERQQIDYYWPT